MIGRPELCSVQPPDSERARAVMCHRLCGTLVQQTPWICTPHSCGEHCSAINKYLHNIMFDTALVLISRRIDLIQRPVIRHSKNHVHFFDMKGMQRFERVRNAQIISEYANRQTKLPRTRGLVTGLDVRVRTFNNC